MIMTICLKDPNFNETIEMSDKTPALTILPYDQSLTDKV